MATLTAPAQHETPNRAVDPPPALIIERDVARPSLNRFPIFAALRRVRERAPGQR